VYDYWYFFLEVCATDMRALYVRVSVLCVHDYWYSFLKVCSFDLSA